MLTQISGIAKPQWVNSIDNYLYILHAIWSSSLRNRATIMSYLYCNTYCIISSKYHQTSNISHTESQHLNVSCLILQLPLPNPLKPGVKSRNYIWLINNFIAYWGVIYIRGLTVGIISRATHIMAVLNKLIIVTEKIKIKGQPTQLISC